MELNIQPISMIFFAAVIIALILSCAVYMRRPAPGANLLSVFILSLALWAFAAGMEISSVQYATHVFWSKVEYIGATSSGALFISFALECSNSNWWRRPGNIVVLWAIPWITLILVWTNEWHHWFWPQISPASLNSAFYIYSHGPWFWVFTVYCYFSFVMGFIILWRSRLSKSGVYRWQIFSILAGTIIPVSTSLVYLFDLSSLRGVDLIPLSFLASGAFYAIAIYRFHFPDVVPIARSTLVENIPDGILVLGSDGEIVHFNPAIQHIKGIDINKTLGKKLDQVWPELAVSLSKLQNNKKAELVIDTPGKYSYLDISMTPLKRNKQSVSGKLVLLRDVTERKAIEKKLESFLQKEHQLSQDLQDEMDKRSKYTRTLVHELKTPLTAILASIDLLEDEIKDNLLLAMVKNIHRSSNNLEKRINELIELARGELGILKINPDLMDLKRLLEDIVSEMSPIASAKGLSLISDIQQIPVISGDEQRLRQVVTNLISNSLKFTAKGSITISARKDDANSVLVQVKDTGKGMFPEEMENLFDPYRRKTVGDNVSVGLGIGLALSKMLIDLHQGKIWAESQPGVGTTFSFTIPLNKPS